MHPEYQREVQAEGGLAYSGGLPLLVRGLM